eukprot:GSMAST32.ASY1.ANO1.597.1 assembled CDS
MWGDDRNSSKYNDSDASLGDVELALKGDNLAAVARNIAAKESVVSFADKPHHSFGNNGQGTLEGVFIPCVQNILGVIMFLRVGWMTGQAGLALLTGLMVLCVSATTLTSLSLSALATNGKVASGGPYYVVSRNLGPAYGGAIGILFYLGTTIAGSMYALGAIEALQAAFEFDNGILGLGENTKLNEMRVGAICVLILAGLIVKLGIRTINTISIIVFGIVMLSVVMMFSGLILHAGKVWHPDNILSVPISDNFSSHFQKDPDTNITPNFTILLGILFPGFTGIMAGTNRSGQLRDAGQSIPRGTLCAICVTFILNLGVAWLGGCVDPQILKDDKTILATIAWPNQYPVAVGIFCSCVGAALQCIAGSAQLLLAIVKDDTPTLRWLLPYTDMSYSICSKGVKHKSNSNGDLTDELTPNPNPNNENPNPKENIEHLNLKKKQGINVGIASLCCIPGNLDVVSPIVTMFFLVMYASINAACCLYVFIMSIFNFFFLKQFFFFFFFFSKF